MDMVERFLETLTFFDWVSPTWALVQDVARGGGHTFILDANCGYGGHDLARYLRSHGVKVWGVMILRQRLMLTVPPRQAQYAAYLLARAGIDVGGGHEPAW